MAGRVITTLLLITLQKDQNIVYCPHQSDSNIPAPRFRHKFVKEEVKTEIFVGQSPRLSAEHVQCGVKVARRDCS